jgi:hypothetical protein
MISRLGARWRLVVRRWRRCAAAALCGVLAAGPAAADCVIVSGRAMDIPVPAGYCAIEPAALAEIQADREQRDGALQAYFVPCGDLDKLRRDPQLLTTRAVAVLVPPAGLGARRWSRAEVARSAWAHFMQAAQFAQLLPSKSLVRDLAAQGVTMRSGRVLGGLSRSRGDEAMAHAQLVLALAGREFTIDMFVAATALNGVPIMMTWTFPHRGPREGGIAMEAMFTYFDSLTQANPDLDGRLPQECGRI